VLVEIGFIADEMARRDNVLNAPVRRAAT